ncbi:MAG: DprA-like winged helix domain-containing protein [Solirubrobacteraceae bacterium]
MSGPARLDALARQLLGALRAEPLDADQLAAWLGVIPAAVSAELDALIGAGLVHPVTVEDGRRAWGLTVKGSARLVGRGGR